MYVVRKFLIYERIYRFYYSFLCLCVYYLSILTRLSFNYDVPFITAFPSIEILVFLNLTELLLVSLVSIYLGEFVSKFNKGGENLQDILKLMKIIV